MEVTINNKKLMSPASSSRIVYLDIIRIIAIMGVICIHVCNSKWNIQPINTMNWQAINIYDGLSRFSVNAFIMVSGGLFLNHNKKFDFNKILSKNLVRIITAFLFWSFLYSLYINILQPSLLNHELLTTTHVKRFLINF